MKKISFYLLLFLGIAFLSQSTIFAQSSTYLNLGVNLPQGNFGSKADNSILFGPDEHLKISDYGGANTGINVGFKFVNRTKAEGLGFMFTVDGLFNKLQNNLKSEDFVPYYVPEIHGIPISVKNPKYFNLPIMAGLNYGMNLNRVLGFFVEAGAGINTRFITPCKITAFDYTLEHKPDYTYTIRYTTKFSFAYQFGAGLIIKNAIYFGVSYFDLGSALVEGKTEKLLKTTASEPVVGEKENFKYRQLSTRMLVLRLGIRLG